MDDEIILLGYSGHAYSVIDAALNNGSKITGYCDFKENKENPFVIKFLGKEVDLTHNQNALFFPSVGDNILRKQLVGFIESKKWRQKTHIYNRKHNKISRIDVRKGRGDIWRFIGH